MLFQEHHQAHLDALNGAIKGAGGDEVTEANQAVFDALVEPAVDAAKAEADIVQARPRPRAGGRPDLRLRRRRAQRTGAALDDHDDRRHRGPPRRGPPGGRPGRVAARRLPRRAGLLPGRQPARRHRRRGAVRLAQPRLLRREAPVPSGAGVSCFRALSRCGRCGGRRRAPRCRRTRWRPGLATRPRCRARAPARSGSGRACRRRRGSRSAAACSTDEW